MGLLAPNYEDYPDFSKTTSPQLPAAQLATKVIQKIATNPANKPDADESLLKQQHLHIIIQSATILVDSAPLVFQVPDGFDSVRFYESPVHVTSSGNDDDLIAMRAGGCTLDPPTALVDKLNPGDQVTYTARWVTSRFADVASKRVQRAVYAEFFKSQTTTTTTTKY